MTSKLPTNGTYVTWRELNLALEPMSNKLEEVSGDVKSLLENMNQEKGRRESFRKFTESRYSFWTLIAALFGSVFGILWLIFGG